ncbi:MAG TPA: aminotransferase class III-fold pyridoxal phosphate-dependent enzyme [Flavisolibacter sp.]
MDKVYPRITHGKGVYIYDENGKEYLDASSGSAAVSNIGHGIKEMAEIMYEQASKITVLPTHAFSSGVVESYLDELVAFAPDGFEKAWTVMSGTEAIENAIKLAYQYQLLRGEGERYKVLGRWSSYHGNSIFTLDVGGMKLRRDTYSRWMNNFPHLSPAYQYRKPGHLSDLEYSSQLIAELEECITREKPETIAAFIVEPVVAAALGAVPPPHATYLKQVKKVCEKHGILLISDEVLTGFGRLGANFGIDRWDVVPDIIAAGKGISGGYFPLSAVLAHQKVMQVFKDTKTPFLGGHTFACNPVGAATGRFVLEYMKEHQIIQHAKQMGDYLNQLLQRLLELDIVGDVRGVGMLQGIELVQDKITKQPFRKDLAISKRIGQACIDKGVVLYPGGGSVDGNAGDHIMITPPLICEKHHIEKIVDVLEASIREVMELSVNLNPTHQ